MSWFTKLLPVILSRATSRKPAREANVDAVLEAVAAASPAGAPALDANTLAATVLAKILPTLPVDATLDELDELGVRLGQVIDTIRATRRDLRVRADALRAARDRAIQED